MPILPECTNLAGVAGSERGLMSASDLKSFLLMSLDRILPGCVVHFRSLSTERSRFSATCGVAVPLLSFKLWLLTSQFVYSFASLSLCFHFHIAGACSQLLVANTSSTIRASCDRLVKFTQLCNKFLPTALLNFACDWLALDRDISFGRLTSPNE